MSPQEFIHGRLINNTDIVSLVSDRIVPMPANLDTAMPYISFGRTQTEFPSPLTNDDPFRRYTYDLLIVSRKANDNEILVDFVIDELHLLNTDDATCVVLDAVGEEQEDCFASLINLRIDLDR